MAGRHRGRGRERSLLLVWLLAGAAIAWIVLRGAPLGEPPAPAPPAPTTPLRVGPLDPCPRGWSTWVVSETESLCVTVTPPTPRSRP